MASSTATATIRVKRQPRYATQRMLGRAVLYLLVTVAACLFIGPFLWTVASSLKHPAEIIQYPPTLLPAVPQWGNYIKAWNKVPFASFYWNSFVVVVLAVSGQCLTATIVAYGFSRFRFPGRDVLFILVLSTLMIPREVTIIPSFLLFRQLGWLDTLAPLIVPYWFGGGPFYIFLLRQFFMTIPRDFDEAARIDGASSFRVLWNVLVPLCVPVVTTVAIFSFLDRWNEFLEPLIYLNSPETFTVALGLRFLQTLPLSDPEPREHLLMAGTVMMAAPSVLLFFFAQRYFVKGIVMSGIKG